MRTFPHKIKAKSRENNGSLYFSTKPTTPLLLQVDTLARTPAINPDFVEIEARQRKTEASVSPPVRRQTTTAPFYLSSEGPVGSGQAERRRKRRGVKQGEGGCQGPSRTLAWKRLANVSVRQRTAAAIVALPGAGPRSNSLFERACVTLGVCVCAEWR
ncbi:hypothetical protein MHYP_G00212510 [Metynnis hypsauchen]